MCPYCVSINNVYALKLKLKVIVYLCSKLHTDDDQMKILSKYGDMGGGQYVVEMKKTVEQLTWVCIENIITEKFGTKAARIFR